MKYSSTSHLDYGNQSSESWQSRSVDNTVPLRRAFYQVLHSYLELLISSLHKVQLRVMFLDPLWRPAEDDRTIINERTWLAGTILAAVAYGTVFTLFVLTFKQLVRTTTKDNRTQRLCFIIYMTVMLILGTVYIGSVAKMGELSFIDYRMFPGGPGSLPSSALKKMYNC
jgi:hypothetical protein